jgi:PAS domain S-box-containing protein
VEGVAQERLTVVVVDDAPEVRGVVKLQLELSGRFDVAGEGATGVDAVELTALHRPAFVVLDASMPDMDGLEAIPRILEASPSTRIVMLSGFEGASLRSRALELGAADYIEKSRSVAELPNRLEALLGPEPVLPDDAPRAVGSGAVDVPTASTGDPPATSPDVQTSRRNSGEILALHLERFRTVFDQAAIGMATLTLTGTIVRANGALRLVLGQQEATLVGRPYAEMAAPSDRQAVQEAVGRASQRGGAVELEHRLAAGSGLRWVKSTLAAVLDDGGSPLYLFAQTEDVTVRRQALDELRASEERFRLMVESVQDYAIFMLDCDGHVSTWNQGAERLKGYSADEIVGRHFRNFYPRDAQDVAHPEHELEVAVREGRYEEEGWRVRQDGTLFWANVVITALFDTSGTHIGFAKVTRDMTERRQAMDAAERAAADLAATNRDLQSAARQTEEFLAVTAHELQSPVTAITGAAGILLDHWQMLDEVNRRESLQRISSSGGRIRRLLADLLMASRIEAGSFELSAESVDLGTAITEAVTEVGAEDIEVLAAADTAVRADPVRLVQILTNLLVNARRYGKPPITLEVVLAGEVVEVAVSDAGHGVADDVVPHLFEKFSPRARPGSRGSGLGLFIVRELARAHGGDAWYDRSDTRHRFVVSLPRMASES